MTKALGLRFITALTMLAALCATLYAGQCTLAGLSWMAGTWRNTSDPARSQERWVVAPENVLMGSSWEFPQGRSGYAEIMTVRQDGKAIVMLLRHFDTGLSRAWEERTVPMVFAASSCESQSVIFDGQGDHKGEHLTYKRLGTDLLIVGDFLHHGTPDHEEWRMIQSKD
jgi:Domain of unknown function (DUF6265)